MSGRCEADASDGGVCQSPLTAAGECSRPRYHADPVSPAKGDRTIDGVPLTLGMKVWDYDLRPAYVIAVDHVAPDGTTWYATSRTPEGTGAWNLFDAQRMWHRHPSTGVLA